MAFPRRPGRGGRSSAAPSSFARASSRRRWDALLLFNRALEADPSFALAAFNRASALFSLERFEEAIDVYNIALRRRPDLPDAWYFKGRALLEAGQPQAAAICLEKAIDLRPNFDEALVELERARDEEDAAR